VEKLLPQNIEAECGVLGSIIIDPEAIVQVADFLYPEDFYRDAHRTIYEVILQLYEQREPADFITICDELAQQNKLEDVGGASYITSLINQVPTSGNVEHYGRIVERTAILRRLIHAAGQIAAIAYEEGDADIALDKAEQLIFTIGQRHARSDFSTLRDLLSQYMGKLEQLHEHRGTIVGVPTGFADLDRLTGGLQKSDLIILAARPGIGKCLTARTLIDDPETGERLTIEECVQRQLPNVYGLSEEGRIRPTTVTAWVDSGVQPCYRIQTRTGRMVEVTEHHPFLTVHGWQSLYGLQVGQCIAVPTRVECFGNDESWAIEKVRLLAYFIAEGGLTHTVPRFTNADPIIVEDFKRIIEMLFPACAIKQYGIDYAVAQPRNAQTMKNCGVLPKNPVMSWFQELGLMGKMAKDKLFPTCVWKWSRRYLAEFLRVLMSCDGSIYSTSGGYPRIEFTVAAPQLAADVHHAFTRFGIIAKYYRTSHGAWRVEITSPESVKLYQEQIGWVGEKSIRFAEYMHLVPRRLGNCGHAPQETWSLVRAAAKLQGLSLVELARKSGETTRQGRYGGYNFHKNRSIPRYRLAAYAEVLDDASLRRTSSPDVYWDEIVSIEPIGEHQVYDLTVPDGANFIAQDIFVHNSSLALSLAHNTAVKFQNSIAIFSLEMSKEQLVQRFLSMDASIDQQRLRTGWIEDDDWERIVYAMGTLSEANIWIDDTAGISTMEMRSKARRLQAEHGVDLIIVDYLQLMQATVGGKRNINREQEISEISRSLKGLARELNIPVLALAQLSRAVESRSSKVPQLSDLRESGCLAAGTPVYLPDLDIYRPIEQLVGQDGFRVLALNTETWRLETCLVSRAFATGYKPVYRMTTRLGRTIRATANHQFLTIHGWQRLDTLSVGMHIAVPGSQISIGAGEGFTWGGFLQAGSLSRRGGSGVELGGGLYGRPRQGKVWPAIPQSHALSWVIGDELISAYSRGGACPRPEKEHRNVRHSSSRGPARGSLTTGSGVISACSIVGAGDPAWRAGNSPALRASPRPESYWDEVIAIELDGEADVYDLTVDELHNFIASDIVCHNSIEQDSDIVMFIYRDDIYNPESERKNIADIIVAKHRNGPVGELSLYFQASQTRFRDLELNPPTE